MTGGEFSLIERYFRGPGQANSSAPGIHLGIGDDAAVSQLPGQQLLVQTIDTLIAGRHFPRSATARDIAYKALSVNVSDLVAMGAQPWTFLLALTLPDEDEEFLQGFSDGLFEAAEDYSIELVGGDTCRGALSITIQANGLVPESAYLRRSGARPGDQVVVSGPIGLAALGLAVEQDGLELDPALAQRCLRALHRPRARTDLIQILRNHATAAIDVSDGLLADLGHILKSSGVGASIDLAALGLDAWFTRHAAETLALTGGDDYQVVFTVARHDMPALQVDLTRLGLDLRVIGQIVDHGFELRTADRMVDLLTDNVLSGGFDHFAA
jgi:thiamine-monophosphate kinase